MYKNPIILCDYSDPDVIRSGDNYFMVASSFNFTPGLPILASKNLVDWKLVNYAAENIPISRYAYPQNAQGIWAPSFSFHNGVYYIIVGIPDEGIYITQTENLLDKWSPLKQIVAAKGFIDPFLFWDDDGRTYVYHAYAKSRCGFNSKIGVLDFDFDSCRCIGEDRIVYDGTVENPTIEGPKVYKRNGFYYIFAPAGGVAEGWQSVLRSKFPEGPWESRVVLHQGNTEINGPHQGALVETPFGESWFVHFQERGIYGRVTHLEPVVWKDDWPLMGSSVKDGIIPGEPVLKYRSPQTSGSNTFNGLVTKNVRAFDGAGLSWQWSGNHTDAFAKLAGAPNEDIESFRLNVMNVSSYSEKTVPVLWNSSNVLTRKICYDNFYFKANADLTELPVGARTGIIFIGDEYASVAVERTKESFSLVYIKSENTKLTDVIREETEVQRISLALEPDNQSVCFRMDFIPFSEYSGAVQFTVKTDKVFRPFKWKSDFFTTENAHWVGGRFGLYAIGKEKGSVLYYNIKVRH